MKLNHSIINEGIYDGNLIYIDKELLGGFKFKPKKYLKYDGIKISKLVILNPILMLIFIVGGMSALVWGSDLTVNSAIEICGTEYSSDELCDILIKDIKFYEKSGGGVTFSGGEPLLQPDFVFECVKILKENGISCAVETALNVPQETVIRAAEFFDLFMCDIKAIDDNLHKNLTSVSNKRILENIRLLAKLKSNILLRMPVAMGLNGTDKNITDTAGFMKEVGLSDIELLKLHKLAKHKYDSLNLPFTFPDVPETTDEDIERFYKLIKEGLYE